MVYKHAYLNTHALNSHGHYIVNHEKSWKNHGIVFFEFLWEPCTLHVKVWLGTEVYCSHFMSVFGLELNSDEVMFVLFASLRR